MSCPHGEWYADGCYHCEREDAAYALGARFERECIADWVDTQIGDECDTAELAQAIRDRKHLGETR